MIKSLILWMGLVLAFNIFSQSLDRQLTSAAGGEAQYGNYLIGFSIGEPIVAQAQANEVMVYQGFQQPSFTVQIDNRLIAKALLQGPYFNGSMNPYLSNQGLIPLMQPYNEPPWYYSGNESVPQIPANAVDWVLIELRTTADTIVARRAGILLSDGSIVDVNGQPGLTFNQVPAGMYFLVIDHRNHMPLMTAQAVPVPSQQVYDLATTGGLELYGGANAAIGLSGGMRGLIAGDLNKNLQLKYSGAGNDRSLILQQIVAQTGSNSINTVLNGYYRQDVNLNGQIKYSGPANDASLIIQNLVNLTGNNSINTVYNCPVPQGIVK